MESIRISSKSTINTGTIDTGTIGTSIRISGIGGNSRGVDILDWAGDEDVVAVFGLLQLNKLGISWGGGINSLESSGLVLDGLLGHGGDGVDSSKSKSISSVGVWELRSTVGNGNSDSGENNLKGKANSMKMLAKGKF